MKTVFLDRDGVINKRLPDDYVKSWEEFAFLPGAIEALRELKRHGFRLILVTNQRGISLGRLREDDLHSIHARMQEELRPANASLDAIYYCPHDHHSCQCRKPGIGMFQQALRDFPDIEFPDSFVIGDSLSDMEAGARIGARLVLVGADTGPIGSTLAIHGVRIAVTAPSLLEAAQYLIPERG